MPARSRLAQLLQATSIAHFVLIAAWIAWRWPASPMQAIGVGLVLLLIGPIVLAVEFVMSALVSRSDATPRATPAQLLRSLVAESAHLFRTFWWRQPFRWRAVPDFLDASCQGRTGVVFVHGFMCNRGFWNAWMRRLRARGQACAAVNLEPVFGSIDDYAPAVEEAVARVSRATGRAPVLICHSMGGLAARAWWRATRGSRPVAALVTIAAPHGGTWMGRLSQRTNGRQMRLRSDWLQQLARDEERHPLPPTTCWYSNCDNIVFPPSTATLPGADNHFVPGEPHVALAFHPDVIEGCLALLQQADASAGQVKSVTGTAMENS